METMRKGEPFYADSAHCSAATVLRSAWSEGLHDMYEAYTDRPLTKQQEGWNKARAKIRARVEHLFARTAWVISSQALPSIQSAALQ